MLFSIMAMYALKKKMAPNGSGVIWRADFVEVGVALLE